MEKVTTDETVIFYLFGRPSAFRIFNNNGRRSAKRFSADFLPGTSLGEAGRSSQRRKIAVLDDSEGADVRNGRILGVVITLMLALGGCKVGPNYNGPPCVSTGTGWTVESAIPTEMTAAGSAATETAEMIDPSADIVYDSTDLCSWWHQLNDPALDILIHQAAVNNPNLQRAACRIFQARAQLCTVRADLFPRVDMDGLYRHSKNSTATGNFGGGGFGFSSITDTWSWGMNANWEVDLFGRLRRLVEASEADIQVSIEDYRNTLIILLADVARNYVDARAFEQRIAVVEQNIAAQQRTLGIAEQRRQAQLTTELDVAQARANLMSSLSELPPLRLARRQALNRLSTLLGMPPGAVDQLMAQPAPIPPAPEYLAVGIPADLLRRRPDIRSVERQLAAQTARIGVAVADLYPQFSISGTFGLDARDFNKLFTPEAVGASIGPAFRWNIFAFGKFRCRIVVQEAIQRQLAAQYEQTVLLAAEEVDNAIAAYVRDREQYAYLQQTVAAYQRSVDLSEQQYQAGRVSFQRVLDSQRQLLQFQNRLIQTEASVTNRVIALYRALGGGWWCSSPQAAPGGAGELTMTGELGDAFGLAATGEGAISPVEGDTAAMASLGSAFDGENGIDEAMVTKVLPASGPQVAEETPQLAAETYPSTGHAIPALIGPIPPAPGETEDPPAPMPSLDYAARPIMRE